MSAASMDQINNTSSHTDTVTHVCTYSSPALLSMAASLRLDHAQREAGSAEPSESTSPPPLPQRTSGAPGRRTLMLYFLLQSSTLLYFLLQSSTLLYFLLQSSSTLLYFLLQSSTLIGALRVPPLHLWLLTRFSLKRTDASIRLNHDAQNWISVRDPKRANRNKYRERAKKHRLLFPRERQLHPPGTTRTPLPVCGVRSETFLKKFSRNFPQNRNSL